MLTLETLDQHLQENRADYALLRQEGLILSAHDAARYYDVRYAAPTLIVQTERGLMSLIYSAQRGRLDLDVIRSAAGLEKLKLADRKKAEKQTGYAMGAVPLVGLELPCLFDDSLLAFPYIYGGSGDPLVTLKIAPGDVKRLNPVFTCFR